MTDPVLDILGKVGCGLKDSKVRVIESRFTDDRLPIARQLKKLGLAGCDVEVLARYEPSMKSPGKKVAEALGPFLRVLPYEEGDSHPRSKNTTHAKLVAIDASISGSASKQTVVLTGSHNLNQNSLRENDELLVEIRDRPVLFDSYLGFYDRTIADAIAAGHSP